MLQRVAVCCNVSNDAGERERHRARMCKQRNEAVCCSVLQCFAVCCSLLNGVAVRCSEADTSSVYFPQKSPVIGGSFAEIDLQLEADTSSV